MRSARSLQPFSDTHPLLQFRVTRRGHIRFSGVTYDLGGSRAGSKRCVKSVSIRLCALSASRPSHMALVIQGRPIASPQTSGDVRATFNALGSQLTPVTLKEPQIGAPKGARLKANINNLSQS